MSLVKSLLLTAALLEASTISAQMLGNWDINFLSLDTNFTLTSVDELILHYEIGKGRDYQIDLFNKDCATSIEGINVTYTDTLTLQEADASHDLLDVALDIPKSKISDSTIWWAFGNRVQICVRLRLLSGDTVVKEDPRFVTIAFDFSVDFTTDAVVLDAVSKSSGMGYTTTDSYIEACKCSSIDSFECNADTLSSSEELYLCIRSASPDFEISDLMSLTLTQGSETMVIIDQTDIKDPSISQRYIKPNFNGVGIAMLVPTAFWSYDGQSSATFSGTIWLMLTSSETSGRQLVNLPRILADDEPAEADIKSFQVDVGLEPLGDEVKNAGHSALISIGSVFGVIFVVVASMA